MFSPLATASAAPTMDAAPIIVNTLADNDPTGNGACSLREAINAANSDSTGGGDCAPGSGADTITFDASLSGGTVSLSAQDGGSSTYGATALVVSSPISIVGDATSGIVVERAGEADEMRLFVIVSGGSLTVKNVTLRNFVARGGDGGGGYCSGGGGAAGVGGAIYLDGGALILENSTLTGNQAIGGDGGIPESSGCSIYTFGGGGGGLAEAGSSGSGVQQGRGGGPNGGTPNGGNGGWGGGGGGGAGSQYSGGNGGGSSKFGGGGGGGMGDLSSGTGGQGGFGGGGGGSVNGSGGESAWSGGRGGRGGGGGSGMGGAIFNDGGTVTVVNSTLSGNTALGGDSDLASYSGGGGGYGSAIFNYNGTLQLTFVTVAFNTAAGGTGNSAGGATGAVFNLQWGASYPYSIVNSIIASNTGGSDQHSDSNSVAITGGGSLVGTHTGNGLGATLSASVAPVMGVDPQLNATLTNNGGPTPTHVLHTASLARSIGVTGTGYITDQRGQPRSAIPDAGAYQLSINSSVAIIAHTPFASAVDESVTVKFQIIPATAPGSVTISDGSTSCSGSLLGGEGTCSLSFSSAGTHNLTATYNPVAGGVYSRSVSTVVQHVVANALTVNTAEGTFTDNGNCSLPEAVKAAMTTSVVDGCNGAPAPGIIIIQPGVGSIEFTSDPTSGDSDSTALTRISGGKRLLIRGNNTKLSRAAAAPLFRFFAVDGGASLTLYQLTLAGGQTPAGGSGGAIENYGTLTVDSCTFSANHTGSGTNGTDGVASSGSESGGNGTGGGDGGYGGAISSTGNLTVRYSLFQDNTTGNGGNGGRGGAGTSSGGGGNGANGGSGGHGGAIYVGEGTLWADGATFVSNRTGSGGTGGGGGGGISSGSSGSGGTGGFGGGMRITSSVTVTNLQNLTFSTNQTGAGAAGGASGYGGGLSISASGTPTIQNSLFVDNFSAGGGGAFYAGQAIAVHNTILGNNTAAGGAAVCGGAFTSLGYNLETGNTCSLTATGDRINSDPELLILQRYNSAQPLFGLPPGSPAVDAGDPTACVATDGRGSLRPQDGDGDGTLRCDIGPMELSSAVWDGGAPDNNASTPANWSEDRAPSGVDMLFLNETSSKDAVFDESFDLAYRDMTVAPGYSGTITFTRDMSPSGQLMINGGTLNLGSTHQTFTNRLQLMGGTFSANSAVLTFNHFQQTGGIFNGDTSTLTFTGDFIQTGGTYNQSTNPAKLQGSRGQTVNVASSLAGLTINKTTAAAVSYWKLDEGTGSTLLDAAGTSNGNLLGGGVSYTGNAPVLANSNPFALNFDGTSARANFPLPTTQGDNFSISLWFNIRGDSAANTQYLLEMGTQGNGFGLYLPINSGSTPPKLEMRVYNGPHCIWAGGMCVATIDGEWINTDIRPVFNTWQHLVLMRQNGTWKMYLDGSARTLTNPSIAAAYTPTGAFSLGSPSGSLNGMIDEVSVYNEALSEEQIQALRRGEDINGVVSLGSDLTLTGALSMTSGKLSLAGYNLSTGSYNQPGGTFLGGSGILSASGAFSQSGGAFTAPSELHIGGAFNPGGGTFSSGSGKIVFNGTGNQSISTAAILNHVEIASSDTVSLGQSLRLTGDLTITSGSFAPGNNSLEVRDFLQNGGEYSGGSATITVRRNLTLANGSFTAGSGTLSVNQGFTQSGGAFHGGSGTMDVKQSFSQNAGTFLGNSEEVIILQNFTQSGGILYTPSASLTVNGDVYLSGGGSIRYTTGGTVTESRSISGNGSVSFPLTGISVDVTSNTNLSKLMVARHEYDRPDASPQDGLYWTLTPTGSATYSLSLPQFHSDDSWRTAVCQYTTGPDWDCAHTSTSSVGVTRAGLTSFGDFATGYTPNRVPNSLSLAPASMQEHNAPGTLVGTLSVIDPDAGDSITYSLVSGEGSDDNTLFTLVDGPLAQHEQLITNQTLDYESKNSYMVRVRATDRAGTYTEERFTISVTNLNETPTLSSVGTFSGTEDATRTIPYSEFAAAADESDPDGPLPGFRVKQIYNGAGVSVGDLLMSGGRFDWTPPANLNGTIDAFSVVAYDGEAESSTPIMVRVNVMAVNDRPSFIGGANQLVDENSGAVIVSGWAANPSAGPSDESSQELSFHVTSNSNTGLFSIAPAVSPEGTLRYTLTDHTYGTASIILVLQDSGGTENSGQNTSLEYQFTIEVKRVNSAPLLSSVSVIPDGVEDATRTILYSEFAAAADESDPDGLLPGFRVKQIYNGAGVSVGDLLMSEGRFDWTPPANVNGTIDAFSVVAYDGEAESSTPVMVRIEIAPVNDAPSFTSAETLSVPEDSGAHSIVDWAMNRNAGAENESEQSLSFIVSDNDHPEYFNAGPGVTDDGTLYFTLAEHAVGTANLMVTLHDNGGTAHNGQENSFAHRLTIAITAINHAPSLSTVIKNGEQDLLVTFSSSDLSAAFSDRDGDAPAIIKIVSLPQNGVLKRDGTVIQAGEEFAASEIDAMSFMPDVGWKGNTSFTWNIADPGEAYARSAGTVSIWIAADNLLPSAGADLFSTDQNTAITIANVLANDSDPDGGTLSLASVDKSGFIGTLTDPGDGTFTYDPGQAFKFLKPGQTAKDRFHYTLSDGQGGTANGLVEITINGLNDAPSTVADHYATPLNHQSLTVNAAAGLLANDSDVDEDSLTVSWCGAPDPQDGVLTVQPDGSFTFTPSSDGSSLIQLIYKVSDGSLEATGNLTIEVDQTGKPAVTAGADGSGLQSVPITLLLATYTDAHTSDSHSAHVWWGDGSDEALLAVNGQVNGSHQYANNGTYPVTVTVTDSYGMSGSANLHIQVNNSAPRVELGTDITLLEGETINLSGDFIDAAQGTWTATVDYGEGAGAQALTLDGKHYAFSHSYLSEGTYFLTLAVTDDQQASGSDTLTVTVQHRGAILPVSDTRYAKAGHEFIFTLNFIDPGLAEAHEVTLEWSDGHTQKIDLVAGVTQIETSRVFTKDGNLTVRVTVKDAHGAVSIQLYEVQVEVEKGFHCYIPAIMQK